jgi:CheY-like chemotaxis protein
MGQPVRVLIADDRAQARDGLRALLSTAPEVTVIGEANNGQEAVHLVQDLRPDVVLMDAKMPEMDGLEATRTICRDWPEGKRPRIIAMTANVMAEDREACFAAGMDDYLGKPIRVEQLVAALDASEPAGAGAKQDD